MVLAPSTNHQLRSAIGSHCPLPTPHPPSVARTSLIGLPKSLTHPRQRTSPSESSRIV